MLQHTCGYSVSSKQIYYILIGCSFYAKICLNRQCKSLTNWQDFARKWSGTSAADFSKHLHTIQRTWLKNELPPEANIAITDHIIHDLVITSLKQICQDFILSISPNSMTNRKKLLFHTLKIKWNGNFPLVTSRKHRRVQSMNPLHVWQLRISTTGRINGHLMADLWVLKAVRQSRRTRIMNCYNAFRYWFGTKCQRKHIDWMHDTVRCLGYPSDSTRAARERARETTCGRHLRPAADGHARLGWVPPSLGAICVITEVVTPARLVATISLLIIRLVHKVFTFLVWVRCWL